MNADAHDGFDWQAWRREVRRDRIDARTGLAASDRDARNARIDAWLGRGFAGLAGLTVAFCWPFRGEPDARFAIRRWRAAGSTACLPQVAGPRRALIFRQWWPGAPMATGVYGIPYPRDTPECTPQALAVPVVGFDPEGYRLGYGGGYFDRTLAAMETAPVTVGLGHAVARLGTIHPRAHDIPFDFMVTEVGIEARIGERLQSVRVEQADVRVRQLIAERGLQPRERNANPE